MNVSLFQVPLAIGLLWMASSLAAGQQAPEFPMGVPTSVPGIVTSPFPPHQQLDVSGFEPGQLAQDPGSGKIFRIPYAAQTPIAPPLAEPPQPGNRPAPSYPPQGASPLDPRLAAFLAEFNASSNEDDPTAGVRFYAATVNRYFGKANVSRAAILEDRRSFMQRWPQRNYTIVGEPVVVGREGEFLDVMMRVDYQVANGSNQRSGSVTNHLRLRELDYRYEIVEIDEARALPPDREVVQNDERQRYEQFQLSPDQSPYERYLVDRILLFIDAFVRSGEVNDPGATLPFLAEGIDCYYAKRHPTQAFLLKDRSDYIARWPQRRYWLLETPRFVDAGDGIYRLAARMGYEVQNGSRRNEGSTELQVTIIETPQGLKMQSVTENR